MNKPTTTFEQFVLDSLGKIEKDSNGFYTGETRKLYNISVAIVLSNDEEVKQLSIESKFNLAKEIHDSLIKY